MVTSHALLFCCRSPGDLCWAARWAPSSRCRRSSLGRSRSIRHYPESTAPRHLELQWSPSRCVLPKKLRKTHWWVLTDKLWKEKWDVIHGSVRGVKVGDVSEDLTPRRRRRRRRSFDGYEKSRYHTNSVTLSSISVVGNSLGWLGSCVLLLLFSF